MAIFGSNYLVDTTPAYESVSPTFEGSEQILVEGSRDIYKILGAAYISDIMIESSVLEGATNTEVLVEGALKELVDKIVKKFKEILAKIKAWFKKVFESIEIFFMSGEKFAKKYETQLVEKARKIKADDVTYEGFEYIPAAQIATTAEAWVGKFVSVVDGKVNKDTVATELIEKAYKAIDSKYTSVAEVKTGFINEVHKGNESPDVIKGANKNVDEMISVCKKQKSLVDGLKKLEETITKRINAFIKDLGSSEKEDEAKVINTKTTVYNAAINLNQGLNATAVSLVKEMYRTYTNVLKKILSFKVAKESFGDDDVTNGSSLFESALAQL